MEHQINRLTLGVSDLEKMTNWYNEIFGWTAMKKDEGVVLFRLDGLALMLVQENQLAKDLCLWKEETGTNRLTLTIGFNTEKEVDRIFDELREKRVVIVREPEKVAGGGYKGFIVDPENNFWELAYYPFIEIDKPARRFLKSEIMYQ